MITQKLKLWQLKTQIVMGIKMTVVTEVVIMTSFSKNTLTPWQPTNSQGSFSQLLRCFSLQLFLMMMIFPPLTPLTQNKSHIREFGLVKFSCNSSSQALLAEYSNFLGLEKHNCLGTTMYCIIVHNIFFRINILGFTMLLRHVFLLSWKPAAEYKSLEKRLILIQKKIYLYVLLSLLLSAQITYIVIYM